MIRERRLIRWAWIICCILVFVPGTVELVFHTEDEALQNLPPFDDNEERYDDESYEHLLLLFLCLCIPLFFIFVYVYSLLVFRHGGGMGNGNPLDFTKRTP